MLSFCPLPSPKDLAALPGDKTPNRVDRLFFGGFSLEMGMIDGIRTW